MSEGNGNGQPRIAPADYRHTCGRLLFRGTLAYGTQITIRCPKCGRMHMIDTNRTSVISESPARILPLAQDTISV